MKILQNVPEVIFQAGSFSNVQSFLPVVESKYGLSRGVWLVDQVFRDNVSLPAPLDFLDPQMIVWVDTSKEPTTSQADSLTSAIRPLKPDYLIGLGGGSVLDLTKGVSILLTNSGCCADYQGWGKVKERPVFKIGIPTLSGTGSEVSRTCIFTSPVKKQGINDDASRFDMLMLDPDLNATVPAQQQFFTAMDCYIHSVESVRGTMINSFSRGYAEKALELCTKSFLGTPDLGDIMTASYFGGCSIVYAEVGVCHALSYGLSFILGYRHGEANCLVFDQLDEYYPQDIGIFRRMLAHNKITLQRGIIKGNVTDQQLDKMVELAYLMEKPLTNAFGENWRSIFTPEIIKEIYLRI